MALQTYTPAQLLARVRKMPEHMPISGGLPLANSHDSHKHHWLKWLEGYDTPGYYKRTRPGGRDAAYVYNHLQCPEMLVYLAEGAVTENSDELRVKVYAASRICLLGDGNRSARSAKVRKVLPWHVVCPALWPA